MELDGLDFKGFDFVFNSVLNNSDDGYIDSFFDEPTEEWQEEDQKEKLTITVQVETIQDKDIVREWLDKQGYSYKIT